MGSQWPGLSLGAYQGAQSRQAKPEEARQPSWGTARGHFCPCCHAAQQQLALLGVRAEAHEAAVERALTHAGDADLGQVTRLILLRRLRRLQRLLLALGLWCDAVHGAYGTPEASTRAAYVQRVGPRGQAALCLRYVQHADGWHA